MTEAAHGRRLIAFLLVMNIKCRPMSICEQFLNRLVASFTWMRPDKYTLNEFVKHVDNLFKLQLFQFLFPSLHRTFKSITKIMGSGFNRSEWKQHKKCNECANYC